ncbi:hypothetical protein N7517_002388 [Penicillium concentricum]|uniref:AAA+ ATPase domain-containing protein n=1 Tax=Penicillium concentricum TaxID=293559 RepID=A0A9W9VJR7_9EURO|nr:uncharacterized protein N7517_002388 [Penicillium concentricum]KAJ5384477.1 hypothetical protein N7517_002388 [Penicillium concentricum]
MEHRGTIINRFSEQAFSGFDHELDQPNRQDLAVIDVISSVHGTFPEGKHRRKNQSRKNFGTPLLEDDRAPFELGKDFIVRSKDRAPSIRVFSPQIIEHIRNELRYYPTLNIPDIELIVHPPYEPLAFCHDGLVAAAQDVDKNLPSPDEVSNLGKTRNHFRVLLDWFQPYYQKEIEPEKDVHRRGKATFPNLWLLYKPGSTVFAGQGKSISFYKVLSFSPKDEKHERRWVLSVWGLDFNGLRLGRRAKTFEIAEFEGEKAIKQLPVKPIRHMEQDDGDEEALTERGKSYYQIIRQAPVHLQYKGALSGNNLLQYSGKIMIDPTNYPAKPRLSSNSHLRMLGTAAPSSPSSLDKRDIASDFEEPKDMGGGPLYSKFNDVVLSEEIQPGDEEMYLLMPSKIRGFALGKNQWAEFDISGVYALDPMSAPFGSLAIGDTELHLIRALGLTDFTLDRDDTFRNDFVQGKGLNQVILLHGPPGVGKTLTVECLAEELGRPLLNLTVADIGTKESEMEHRLAGWLDLAQRWNAIVLIDEADIYLARRERNELQRSALVTAFLRTLEYFIGLMFLTTNQPGFIDDAFNSRFHLIIEYPRLNEEQRTTIWQSFLHKLHRDQGQHNQPTKIRINVLGDVQNYLTTNTDVKALELNGRDIRNAFHAAIQIAIHRTDEENRKRYRNQGIGQPMTDVDLTVNDIKKVIDNKAAYRAYLTNVHGQNEEERALDYGGRRT